jgi:hypothetical protein
MNIDLNFDHILPDTDIQSFDLEPKQIKSSAVLAQPTPQWICFDKKIL